MILCASSFIVYIISPLQLVTKNLCLSCIPLLQVYDVTPFLDDHPGGDEVLVTATGN